MSAFNIDDLTLWLQVLKDGERTIICHPEWESRVKCLVDAHGLGGMITVHADRDAPEDKLIVIDENAIEAGQREALQRETHETMAAWRRSVARELADWRLPPTINPKGITRITEA